MKLTELPYKEKNIFRFFEEISAVPRVSGNTAPIVAYLENFAKERGLRCYRDNSDNVVIYKAATQGYENRPTVILQGHSDMVGAIAPSISHDFSREGVKLVVDGDKLRADGTTLGGDDGVALAYMLAILDGGDEIYHPSLECVFTSDEETGLFGATALDANVLAGRRMINLDMGEEGIFIVGCAGGVRIDLTLPFAWERCEKETISVTLSGFAGGHSGEDINKGRLNAIKELAIMATELSGVQIAELTGGTADNVIATEANVKLICNENAEEVKKAFEKTLESIKKIEKGANFEIKSERCYELLSEADSRTLLNLICALPFGVYAMSCEIPDMVETSSNIGIVRVNGERCTVSLSVRSSVEEEKLALAEKIENTAKNFGATHLRHADYPGWQYAKHSPLRDTMCKVFYELYGKDARVCTVHAGLECGIFSKKLDGLDCISIGPDNPYLHSVNEYISISSFVRTYQYLKRVLKEI